MPREDKVEAVERIKEQFEGAGAAFLTEFRGLSVAHQQELRRSLRAAGSDYKVMKMSLARRAADDMGLSELTEWLAGPTAITFVHGDPVLAAKALKSFSNDHEALILKVGLLDGRVLPPEQVSRLADIEPYDLLLAHMAGAFQAPLVKLAGLLSAFTRNAASAFSQLLEKKEAEEPAEVEVSETGAQDAGESGAHAEQTDAHAEEPGPEESVTDQSAPAEDADAERPAPRDSEEETE